MGIKIVIPLIFWYLVRMFRESLYAQVIFWVTTILNHIDTGALLLRYEGSCMVNKPKWY